MFQASRLCVRRMGGGAASRRGFSAATAAGAREPATEAEFPAPRLQTKLFINNDFVDAEGGKTFPSFNPGNGEKLADVAHASAGDVDRAVQAAHAAFFEGEWSRMLPRDRGACLSRLSQLIFQNLQELAQIESLDNGKPFSQSSTVDAPACGGMLNYYSGWPTKLTGQTMNIGPNHNCVTYMEPVGVCGMIIPWNLPLIGVAAKLGPALAAGNTVVLKPAEHTSLSALRLAELVQEAGFPKGVVNFVAGDGPSVGEPLVTHPLVDKISFTGSTRAGKRIQELAAQGVKNVTLELGGNNPVVVCADADLELAVNTVHNGLFWNDGEACAAGSRIFVHESVYPEFVARSAELVAQRRVGNPFSAGIQQGAQCSQQQLDKILGYVEDSRQRGATVLVGGERVGTKGYYMQPTMITDFEDDWPVFQDEVFGPVLTVTKFKELDEVVRRANDTPYGLAAGVFSRDSKTCNYLRKRIRAGMVFVNCYHVVDTSAPFGGVKQSGIGREGGTYGLEPYLEPKMVVESIV